VSVDLSVCYRLLDKLRSLRTEYAVIFGGIGRGLQKTRRLDVDGDPVPIHEFLKAMYIADRISYSPGGSASLGGGLCCPNPSRCYMRLSHILCRLIMRPP